METLMVIAIVCGVIGLIGCIVPAIPGPLVSWIGVVLAYYGRIRQGFDDRITLTVVWLWLAIMILVTVLDCVVPAKFTKMAGGSKAASRGATIGLIAGMFFTPIGMIAGSLLGAFLGELIVADKDVIKSAKAALGAFLGFLIGTGIKLIASGCMFYVILR